MKKHNMYSVWCIACLIFCIYQMTPQQSKTGWWSSHTKTNRFTSLSYNACSSPEHQAHVTWLGATSLTSKITCLLNALSKSDWKWCAVVIILCEKSYFRMHGQHHAMAMKLTRFALTVGCCKCSFGFGLIRDCTTQIFLGKKGVRYKH